MPAPWTQLAQYLNSISPNALGQAQPFAAPVTQADVGQVNTQPPADPTASMAPPLARAPSALKTIIPRQPVAGGGNPSTFANRTPQGDLERIRELWDRQEADVDKTRADADKLEKQPLKPDLSWLAGLTSAWGGPEGQQIAKSYEKPLDAEGRAMMLAKLRAGADTTEQGIIKDRQGLALGGDKNDSQFLKMMLLDQKRQLASQGELKPMQVNLMAQQLGNSMNAYKQARGAFGGLAQTQVRAARAAQLINRYESGAELNKQDIADTSQAVAALISSGGGAATEGLINSISPQAAKLDYNGLVQYFSSTPHAAELAEWVHRLGGTIKAEAALSDAQIRKLNVDHLAQHQILYENRPDIVYKVARHAGISKKEVDDALANSDELSTGMPMTTGEGAYTKEIAPGNSAAALKPQYSASRNQTRWVRPDGTVEKVTNGKP